MVLLLGMMTLMLMKSLDDAARLAGSAVGSTLQADDNVVLVSEAW